jgi:urate oxidase
MLWGDFAESWTTGSNTKIIATETQKNTIYKLAQDSGQTLLCPLPC